MKMALDLTINLPAHGTINLSGDYQDSGIAYDFVVLPTTATAFDNGTSPEGAVDADVDMHSIDENSLQKMTGKVSIVEHKTQQKICYVQYSFVNGGVPQASAVFDSTKIAHCDVSAYSATASENERLLITVYTH